MPSSVIGALRVSLGLDSAQFETGAAKAEKRGKQLGSSLSSSLQQPVAAAETLKGTIAGLAGALALKELAGAAQRAFDYADAIADLSDRTGASTKVIQEFRYAAQLSGSSVETADAALEKFARTQGLAQAGGDAQVKLFKQLGVTSTDFDTALRQTLDGIAKLPTVQQRAAMGFQIFGKSSATLTQLLGQGSAGFQLLADRAEQLGVVLRDDVIRNAGQANDQLDTMKMIVNAQFANTVAQNADSLVAMAQGIADLTGALIKFMSSNPQAALSIIGGLAGSRGGPVGAAIGAFGGYVAGDKIKQNQDDNNTDLAFRRSQFRAAIANRRASQQATSSGGLFSLRTAQGTGSAQSGTAAEVVKQGNLYKRAIAAAQGRGPASSGKIPTVGTAEAASNASKAAAAAKKAEADKKREAEKAYRDEKRYQQELTQSRNEYLAAQGNLSVEATDRAAADREQLANEIDSRAAAIRADKDLTDEQKKQLLLLNAQTGRLQADLINRQENEALAKEALDLAEARNSNDQDVLSAQSSLARTAKERQAIELKILDLQFQQMRAVQEAVLASSTATDNEKKIASARLGTLDQLQSYSRAKVVKDTQGPLASYVDSIPKTADEMNEALQGVEAQGLESLIDGVSKAKGSFKDLATVVSNVADDIIASLVKIGLQKGIAALFGNLLGAGSSLGSGSFSASDFTNTGGGSLISGYRAKGGSVTGGKNYIVGEQGPELFRAPGSGTIVANDDIGTGGGMKFEQHLHVEGGVDLATRTEVVRLASATKDAAVSAIRDADRRRG